MSDVPKRQLLINYLLGLCTPEEVKAIEQWLDKEPGNSSLLQEAAKNIGHQDALSFTEKSEIKNDLFAEIDMEERSNAGREKSNSGTRQDAQSSERLQIVHWVMVAEVVLINVKACGICLLIP